MKLKKAFPNGKFEATCKKCNKRMTADEPKFADLEGEPFNAYYCSKCAEELKAEPFCYNETGEMSITKVQNAFKKLNK